MKRKYGIAVNTAAGGLFFDLMTKIMVENTFISTTRIPLIPGFLELIYAQNTGMAFGLFQDFPAKWQIPFFTLITAIALTIIIHLLRQAPEKAVRFPLALGLIMAGALGNLFARYLWGYVVDFIEVTYWPPDRHWPIFNLADTWITIGIVLLLLDSLFTKEPKPQPASSPGSEVTDQLTERNIGEEAQEAVSTTADDSSPSSPPPETPESSSSSGPSS